MVICRLWTSIRSGQMSSRPEILEPLSSMLLTIITSSMDRQLARMRLKLFLSRVVGTTLATAQRRITLLTVRSHFAAGGVPNSRRPFCAFGKSYPRARRYDLRLRKRVWRGPLFFRPPRARCTRTANLPWRKRCSNSRSSWAAQTPSTPSILRAAWAAAIPRLL